MKVGQRIDCYNVKASDYSAAGGKDVDKTFISNERKELLFIPLSHPWDWSVRGGLTYSGFKITKVGTLVIRSIKS